MEVFSAVAFVSCTRQTEILGSLVFGFIFSLLKITVPADVFSREIAFLYTRNILKKNFKIFNSQRSLSDDLLKY